MLNNLARFNKDLDRLILLGQRLYYAMLLDIAPNDGLLKQLEKHSGKEDAQKFIKALPKFNIEYEAWYSESLALLKQLLPDRIANFISLYEKPKNRKEISYGNYVIQDYLQNLRVTFGGETKVEPSAAAPQFEQQLSIIKACKVRFDSSLFEIRQLVQADLFDSELEAARELHKSKFHRAAGVVAGVVLEKHLKQVCGDRGISITKKHPTLNDLTESLKSTDAIDVPTWRHLAFLADLRNLCAHNKQKEPTQEQVSDLLDGTEKTIKTVF